MHREGRRNERWERGRMGQEGRKKIEREMESRKER